MSLPLSVIIPTLNEESQIEACIASASWADEVLVVDSASEDRTCEAARAAGARVLVHPFEGYGAQKNWAAAEASHSWVLALDADERITPELRDEIRTLLSSEPTQHAYRIPRRSRFAGRWIHHGGWQRDRVGRLYARSHAQFSDRLVHERLESDGPQGDLEHHLLHYTYASFDQYMRKVERYADAGARELQRQGRSASVAHLLVAPPARFVRMYGLQGGFLDGTAGFLLASVAAWGVFAKYARLYELTRDVATNDTPQSTTGEGGS